MEKEDPSHILFMGTYPPRECGIATFTRDLATAIHRKLHPIVKPVILAINNDKTNVYNYPKEVIFQINDTDIDDYIEVAKKINKIDSIKLINIQHEFGIFGGEYGNYLVTFLELINKPVIITFHSVLPNPKEKMKKIVQSLAQRANSLVVMTKTGIDILRRDYDIKTDIKLIPHGIPSVEFKPNNIEKKNLGYKDRIVLSSFGMLNRDKGYEYVIDALPEVVQKFPNLLYLIIGETHPIVRKEKGEKYRNFLEAKVKKLGLEKNVKFYNKYLTIDEILKYLNATDIYLSASQNPHQITSGTLVYAMGSGRAVISTPFLHAKDILNNDRGILLKEFKNPKQFSEALIKILSNPELKQNHERNAYSYTRHMTWPNIALAYKNKFKEFLDFSESKKPLPRINFNHLINLTNKSGIIQFAQHTKPDIESGHSIDDNARAMITLCMHGDLTSKPRISIIKTYLRYIENVLHEGKFFNYMNKHGFIDKKDYSEDAHGRALWALGHLMSKNCIPLELRERAKKLFKEGLEVSDEFKSPRAVAFTIIGLYFFHQNYPCEENKIRIKNRADFLTSLYDMAKCSDWKWFEPYLTYSNSKLPEALFYSYSITKDSKYLDIARNSLDFLISLTFEKEMFCPIGQNGWHIRGKRRSYFDQQPVDTASMIQTLVIASSVDKNNDYLDKAKIAFNWFLGKNHLNQMIYDESTGGCYDGLGQHSINLNQGAESTIAYLMARLTMEDLKRKEK